MNQTILVSRGFTGSKESNGYAVQLRALVEWVNKIYSEAMLSPLSITSANEFQGIVSSPIKGIDIILAIEEYIVEEELELKLKYVLHNKAVDILGSEDDTYEIISEGLTKAKERLNEIKKAKDRFFIMGDAHLNKMMRITQHFIDGWYPKDRSTVAGFLQGRDYKEMSKIQDKDSSSLWRKRKSLAIDEYLLCKEMIHHLIEVQD